MSERKTWKSQQDCASCDTSDPSSSLHRSVRKKTEKIMSKADDLINEISTKTPKRTACGQLQMMKIFKHIFVSKFHISLKNATSKYYSLTEKTDLQKFHKELTSKEKKQ